MSYFVTGATGFIGRYLVSNLLKRSGTVYVLVRKDSQKKFDAIARKSGWDPKRVVAVAGDMTKPRCGLTPTQLRNLNGKIKHFFHLAAVYDLTASVEAQQAANIDGTRHALDLAAALKVPLFHHTSSIAAAGLYPGIFREDMFEEAEGLDPTCAPSTIPRRWCAGKPASSGASTAPAWWSGIRRPARSTRSTARTTSSP